MIVLILILVHNNIISSFFNPGVFFGLVWSIQILISNIFLENNHNSGSLYILIVVFFSLISGFIGEKLPMFVNNKKKIDYSFNERLSTVCLYVSILLGVLYEIFLLRSKGMSILSIFEVGGLLDLNVQNAAIRYGDVAIKSSLVTKVLLPFTYLAPSIGGIHFVLSNKKSNKYLSLLSFLPTFLSLTIENTKSGFISAIILFVSGIIIANLLKNKYFEINLKKIFMLVIITIFLFYLLIFSMVLRSGEISTRMFDFAQKKIIVYALGHISAFNIWFSDFSMVPPNGIGKYTFLGIYNTLGLTVRDQGVFNEFVYINGTTTNVYSFFRSLIMDFSVVGAFLFILLFTILATIAYKSLINKVNIYFSIFILFNYYFFTMFNFTSIWTYSSYILMLILILVYSKMIIREIKNVKEK
ncbi:O-antigen polymerase [Vagococcus martis]|nr:O-antigen polymerase [Vagococcus martis]